MAKYIITLNQSGLPCAVIFNEALTHKDVAGNMKVISAGFVEVGSHEANVYGFSESLNIASNPRDKDYIELALNH
jgi:hypothetical protein